MFSFLTLQLFQKLNVTLTQMGKSSNPLQNSSTFSLFFSLMRWARHIMWMWKPWSDKNSSSCPISRNVNFEPKFLEESRWYLFCLSLLCPHFALSRNINNMTAFSNSSCNSAYQYFGDNHHSLFKNCKSLGGVFPFIPYGDISSCSTMCAAILSSFWL